MTFHLPARRSLEILSFLWLISALTTLPVRAKDAAEGVPEAASDPLASGDAALREGRPDQAIQRFRRASDLLGDTEGGVNARYLMAQALDQRGDQPGAALEAFQAFLARDRAHAPERLVAVAEAAVAHLKATSSSWPAWSRLQEMQRTLTHLPYAQRKVRWEAYLAEGVPASVARAARLMRVQEAREAGDWQEASRELEILGASVPAADYFLHAQWEQALKELRRRRIAWLASSLLTLGVLGGLLARPWKRAGRLEARRAIMLVLNWTVMAWLLYGAYLLGKQQTDSDPVTIERFLLLWGATSVAQVVGLGWSLVGRGRLSTRGLSFLAFVTGVTLGGGVLYLFCYHFDYVSILGL